MAELAAQQTIFLMPGLGLTSQLFDQLHLGSLRTVKMEWLEPETSEQLKDYVLRLIQKYEIDKVDSPHLLGHSLGGVIMQEIAQQINYGKLFVVSSVNKATEIPIKIQFMKRVKVHHTLKKKHLKQSFFLWSRFHDYKSPAQKELFWNSIDTKSDYYFKWCIDQLLDWNPNYDLKELYRLHGTKDSTFPISRIDNCIKVKNGKHLMLISHSEEISNLILDIVQQKSPG